MGTDLFNAYFTPILRLISTTDSGHILIYRHDYLILVDMKWKITILMIIYFSIGAANAVAVDVAPRISDREIIEKLISIKSGQAALSQRLTDLRDEVGTIRAEMKTTQISFREEIRAGQAALREEMRAGQDALRDTMLALFGGLIALIIALFGYIAWDRQTTMRPMQRKIETLSHHIERDLEPEHVDGSRMKRLLEALRELSKTDAKLETVLRNFSLL